MSENSIAVSEAIAKLAEAIKELGSQQGKILAELKQQTRHLEALHKASAKNP